MADGIYVALSGAIAQATSLDTTAGDLANASTDGYQRGRPVFREALAKAGAGEPGLHYGSVATTRLDTTPGPLRDTGRPLDIAMPQGTYLSVSTSGGDRYIRTASMSFTPTGALVTSHGDPVLGDNGKPIKVTGDPTQARLDDTGQIWQADTVCARLGLVTFPQPGALAHESGPLLVGTPEAGTPTPARGPLTLGHIEGSNSSAVGAMTDLVNVTRDFDAYQRVIDAFRDADHNVVTSVPSVS